MPTARTNPRQKAPRAHTSISCHVADAERMRSIVDETGLRHDTTFAAMIRLFELAPDELKRRAGFPMPEARQSTPPARGEVKR